jgi:hypothetical protein
MSQILSPVLKEYLPKKWADILAAKHHISASTVRLIFKGEMRYSELVATISHEIISMAAVEKVRHDAIVAELEAQQAQILPVLDATITA